MKAKAMHHNMLAMWTKAEDYVVGSFPLCTA